MSFVFGYGSLVAEPGTPASLPGFERWWGVAMDNREHVPGYKRYAAPDGSFPPVFVAYVDLRPAARSVRGVLRPVDAAGLAALDARERNYVRTQVELPGVEGPVWTYLGSPAGRARAAAGRAAGTLVVERAYLELVGGGDPGLRIADLHRLDLPG